VPAPGAGRLTAPARTGQVAQAVPAGSADGGPVRQRDRLLQLICGFTAAQTIAVAAELRLADALTDGPRSAEQLAATVAADAPSLRRLLLALACLGVLTRTGPDQYALAPLGEPLRSDAPNSVRELATMICGDAAWRAWGALGHSIRTGETAFRHVFGTGPFEHYGKDPALAANFNAAMADHARFLAPSIAAGFDFSRFSTLVDVGGGDGTLLSALLRAVPTLAGTLLDTPAGAAAAPATLAAAGVADRGRVVEGDFFVSVPPGADAYLLKSIVHDWTDEECRRILANCRRAVPEHGTLLLVEPVLPVVPDPRAAGIAISDLNMLVNTGGRERTESDFAALMRSAGFHLSYVSPPLGPVFDQTVIWTIPYRVLVGRPTAPAG
jgi:hypothetical protein